MTINNKYYLPLLLLLVTVLAFYKLSKHPIYEWDESHTVINAVEMIQNGDIFNLYYVGQPDELRAKPPLFIWVVVTSFEVFGVNKWSLRLPSALFTILAFFLIFKIINLYRSHEFAFMTCLILLPVKAIIGYHVGRTGDFDAMLLVFLLAGLYCLLRYLDGGNAPSIDTSDLYPSSPLTNGGKSSISNQYWKEKQHWGKEWYLYLSGVSFGLAFWTKGPAMGVLIPGILLYLVITRRFIPLLLKKEAWIALGILVIFPLIWFTIVHFYGVKVEQPQFAGDDSFQRMFLYDLLERFTNPTFENQKEATSGWYFFQCLEESFKIWNCIFYMVVLCGILKTIGMKTIGVLKTPIVFAKHSKKLLLLSICIWSTLGLFLSIVTTAKWWYFAPAFPFIAITTYWGIDTLAKKYPITKGLFILLLIATMARRYYVSITTPSYKLAQLAESYCPILQDANQLTFFGKLPRQDVLGQLYICNPNLSFQHKKPTFPQENVDNYDLVLIHKNEYDASEAWQDFEVLNQNDFYTILRKK